MRHQPLGVLLRDLPHDAQVFLTGWAILEEPVALHYSEEEFQTITLSDHKLEFIQAPVAELTRQDFLNTEVLRGRLLIRIVLSNAQAARFMESSIGSVEDLGINRAVYSEDALASGA